ncbi:hypothetical protein RFI_17477 [Reticulomyxa filosa]|uniref:Uncharacterized protein n=1 Tax=Reticulomyxa filosa TaxID=46433 RepID=X6N1Y2_RETFI|nr:hypothetical protein RFI_17477 [Reticulomyxa filosa]|eukprot:ETO19754.1 hypothetical protein RFI_17477 [Reticulomyxa filosa]
MAILSVWMKKHYPIIVSGEDGCGKHKMVKECYYALQRDDNKCVNVATLECNSQTKAIHLIQKLYQLCQVYNSNVGKTLKPNHCSLLLMLIRNINLPKSDKYGTRQFLTFLQQIICYQGFYDPSTLEFVHFEKNSFQFIFTTINHTEDLTTRLTSQNAILHVNMPSQSELLSIYTFYMEMVKSAFKMNKLSPQFINKLVMAMIDIFQQIKFFFN